jgi:hypothetical protein
MITDDQRRQWIAATQKAKLILKVGDRIRATRCGGIKRTYQFSSWDGDWIVTKSGISDIAATHIDRLNGSSVNFQS